MVTLNKGTAKDVLDNPKKIREIDAGGMIDVVLKSGRMIRDAYALGKEVEVPETVRVGSKIINYREMPKGIVVCGMGGSGIVGKLLSAWLGEELSIPIFTVTDYTLPKFVGEGYLVIVVSYSGNTEETICSMYIAAKRGSMIFGVTSNGAIERFCREAKFPFVKIPSGFQPRVALPYLLVSIIPVLESVNILKESKESEITSASLLVEELSEKVSPEVPVDDNLCKRIALGIYSTIPLIYGYRILEPVAYRMKCQLNENAKMMAFSHIFPEMNHNEIVGWMSGKEHPFSVVLIRDCERFEPPEIKARIEICKRLFFENAAISVNEIFATGEKIAERLFSSIFLVDMISVYVAVARGVDPTPVDPITSLKHELEEWRFKEKFINEMSKLISRG